MRLGFVFILFNIIVWVSVGSVWWKESSATCSITLAGHRLILTAESERVASASASASAQASPW